MNNRRDFMQLTGASALTLAASGLLAGTARALTPVWLNTPFHGGDATAMEIIVKQMNDEQSDLRIDLTQGGWTEYYAQLYNAVVAGVAPNIAI